MKIGILNCDYVKPHRQEFGHAFADMFVDLFDEHCPELCCQTYHITDGHYPASPDECDGYLITGSHRGVYENEVWIQQARSYVQTLFEVNKKMVGVCFGHQLLADSLGGRVEKSEKGWGIGAHQTIILNKKNWMSPDLDSYTLNVCHQDQVLDLPPNAERLAGNNHCPNSLFVVGNQCLGIQSHPEISSAYLDTILEDRAEAFGESEIQRARTSLMTRTDEDVVAIWIKNFFLQSPI
jgi:GMP synthase-like glutamine amidotransferase